ncbi:PQQ-dependent sugar dehydrogenase [Rhodococcus coprophilus]|uniref:PQQ-dependent sugar dehydrogenase n=1 Tax=Rhodococcus coprophilus TaxID=38310 RepID=UPI0009326D18|nr:PQQ-dependent sugar dehydrogenase [Rhodococcus coprophilus]MBM7460268.1 glucose/arabinose dehydrogenase [Rhodococcus coprophilus]
MTWGSQSTGSRRVRTAAVALAVGVAVSSCARFDDTASTPFTPEPTFDAGPGFGPQDPTTTTTPPSASAVPSGPCVDPDPAVVATCLDTTGGLVTMPGGGAALVTERRTGRILQVAPDTEPVEVAKIPVDASGDGGLLDVALSPTFDEDRLLYAYITTPTDNRVVRIAAGDTPKDVLTGIPRGATGNGGGIEFSSPTEMVVLTGNAGNPAAATDPASLAGKLLEFTLPAPGAAPSPTALLSGIGSAGDVCRDPGGNLWVTDRTELEDRLQRVGADGSVGSGPAWTWPERPGVAGCAASPDGIAVSLTGAKAVAVVAVDPGSGAVTAAPILTVQDRYGMLRGAASSTDGLLWVSTVNKSGGEPGPNDDRVVRIQFPAGGGGFD